MTNMPSKTRALASRLAVFAAGLLLSAVALAAGGGKPERPAREARDNRSEILERRRDYAEGRLARYRIDVGRERGGRGAPPKKPFRKEGGFDKPAGGFKARKPKP